MFIHLNILFLRIYFLLNIFASNAKIMSFHTKEIYLFLKKFTSFLVVFIFFAASLVLLTKTILLQQFNFNIGQNKKIVILGDSHTQCAVNDSVFQEAINLSESADTYFYSYIKFKRLLKENPQLEILVIGYSYHNVTKNQDNWLTKESINTFKLPLHFFLFDAEDGLSFCKINGPQLPKNTFKIVIKNCTHLYRVYNRIPINKCASV